MLRLITEQLACLPVERSLPVDDEMGEAAILLALVNDPDDPKIILTKRAEHLNSHLRANPDELDAVFDVPLRYLLDRSNLVVDRFTGPDYRLRMPCYIYQGYRIWGFSLVVLTDFLNLTLNAGIELHYPDRVDLRLDIDD